MYKNLPCLDEKYHPQVTFLGLRDAWMKKAGKYKYPHEMDTEIAYNWLRTWIDANHPSFQRWITFLGDPFMLSRLRYNYSTTL